MLRENNPSHGIKNKGLSFFSHPAARKKGADKSPRLFAKSPKRYCVRFTVCLFVLNVNASLGSDALNLKFEYLHT